MTSSRHIARLVGGLGGGMAFGLILSGSTWGNLPEGLSGDAAKVLAVAVLMAAWWMTEAVPIPVTALLPVVLFPVLGILPSAEAARPYANHIIYLFLGGFILAKAMERWGLQLRIALHVVRWVGTGPSRLVLGFMVATAGLSMWVSNTATAMLMLPVGIAVISKVAPGSREEAPSPFATSLMLGIAYAASIGGVATIIGTPPNTFLVGYAEQELHQHIGFLEWMAFGLPLSLVFLVGGWLLLTRVLFRSGELRGGGRVIEEELQRLGPITRDEVGVAVVFVAVAAGWVVRGFMETEFIADATIAMAGAIALFLIPSSKSEPAFLMDWRTAVSIPWGVLVLFGGGLALARGVSQTGLDDWLALQATSLGSAGLVALLVVVVLGSTFLTELTSNTATASLLVPLMAATALALGFHPFGLMVAAAVATSYAFMLPVATPPNAVVYGSGQVRIGQMVRAGLVFNLVGAVLVWLAVLYLLPLAWGLDLSQVPTWAAQTPGSP